MMYAEYATINERATPEYVLDVLRDICRQEYGREAALSLSFDTTIEDWCWAYDGLDTHEFGRNVNKLFGINRSDAEWESVLEPPDEKTLGNVCELIAKDAIKPRIRPAHFFGSTCMAAGVFLTIRSLLHQAGAAADEITPSTPLEPFTSRYDQVFLGPISWLAPGALPRACIRMPIYNVAVWGMALGLLGIIIGGVAGWGLMAAASAVMFFACYALHWIAAYIPPSSLTFGELRTFRDLAVVIAGAGRKD